MDGNNDGSRMFASDRMVAGVAWAQGGREYMQDSYSVNLNVDSNEGFYSDFIGVFDGHGPNGENISRYVAFKLCDIVIEQLASTDSFEEAVENGCIICDSDMRSCHELMDHLGDVYGGSTGCAVWIRQHQLYSCNVGDSRFIISYQGKAVQVTEDHKPWLNDEKMRIYRAGGHVVGSRVNGILAVSRTFGDFMFKQQGQLGPHEQLVSVVPDVRTVDIEDNIDFLVIASDGIWDILSNQEAVDLIIDQMKRTTPLNEICQAVIDACRIPVDPVSGLGSDNMTIIIAVLR